MLLIITWILSIFFKVNLNGNLYTSYLNFPLLQSYYLFSLNTITDSNLEFVYNHRGHPRIVFDGYLYNKNRSKYWRCLRVNRYKCKARLIVCNNSIQKAIGIHTHDKEYEEILKGKEYNRIFMNASENPKRIIDESGDDRDNLEHEQGQEEKEEEMENRSVERLEIKSEPCEMYDS